MRKQKLLWALPDGTKVWLVDGNLVRHTVDAAFTQGGHGYVYDYIPKNEIWVEEVLNSDDQNHNMEHEVDEYNIMKYGGLSYEEAHEIAMEHERKARKKCNSF